MYIKKKGGRTPEPAVNGDSRMRLAGARSEYVEYVLMILPQVHLR